jgi:type IV secretory pathway VirB6-like protein
MQAGYKAGFVRQWFAMKFPMLAKVVDRYLCMHASAAACERNLSAFGTLF